MDPSPISAIKEAIAAMSVYITTFSTSIGARLREGTLDEAGAQELIDQLVQKLRIVLPARRTTTRSSVVIRIGRPMRRRHGPGRAAAGDCTTVSSHPDQPRPSARAQHHRALSKNLPAAFKRYCIKVSRDTSSLQYENDDLMRPYRATLRIACCVSAMRLGKQMLGAQVNLAKCMLYAVNGGQDEVSGDQIARPP